MPRGPDAAWEGRADGFPLAAPVRWWDTIVYSWSPGSVRGRAKDAGMSNSVGTSEPWRSLILPDPERDLRKEVSIFVTLAPNLTEARDLAAARAFFRLAKAVTGVTPDRVTTDGHDAYPRAIRTELGEHVRHRTSRYLNNRLEQDHRGIKDNHHVDRCLD